MANNKNWLVQTIVLKNLLKIFPLYLKGRLIDIGCGLKPLKNYVKPYIDEHIGVDQKETRHDNTNIDYFGTAYDIPFADESFDCAICTAVLEHLEEPEAALTECHRILKKDCYAIYTVPFIWHLHEAPRDFFRYTKYGLKYLFEKTGFEIVELNALSGFWVTFGQLFVYNIYRFNIGPLRYIPIIPIAGLFIQGISYLLDKVDKTEEWTWMYLVVVRKKASPN